MRGDGSDIVKDVPYSRELTDWNAFSGKFSLESAR